MGHRIDIRWATENPQGFTSYNLDSWGQLPSRPVPTGNEVLGSDLGYIDALCIQGVYMGGWDHITVLPLPDGGCQVICWKDDLEDYPGGKELVARVIDFHPYGPDSVAGGAINTKQNQIAYAAPELLKKMEAIGPVQNQVLRPLSEFIPPVNAHILHGIWTTDFLNKALYDFQRPTGWRTWGEKGDGIGTSVPQQRPLGRYSGSKGTITFFKRDIVLASGNHVASNELEMNQTAGAGELVQENIAGATSKLMHMWTSPVGEPGVAWPTDVNGQIDVFDGGADVTYGFRAAGSVTGHIARVNTGLTSDVDTKAQAELLFSLNGIKVYTVSGAWSAGSDADDRVEALLGATRIANHGNQPLDITCNSDSFLEGAWVPPDGPGVDEEWRGAQPNQQYYRRSRRAVSRS